MASLPAAFVVGFLAPLTSATEFLFFPLILIITAVASALLGPLVWLGIRRREAAADGAVASGAACAVLLVTAVMLSTVDELHDWSIAIASAVAVVAYGVQTRKVVRSPAAERRGRWVRASVIGASAGAVSLIALAIAEALVVATTHV